MKPDDKLEASANLYRERSKQYGDNYKKLGFVAHALMPDGLVVTSPADWNRIHLFIMKLVKLTRYAENFSRGHPDSLDDDIVYTAMLAEVDDMVHPQACTHAPLPEDEEIPF